MKKTPLRLVVVWVSIIIAADLLALVVCKVFMTPPSVEHTILNPDWQLPMAVIGIMIVVIEDLIVGLALTIFLLFRLFRHP